jgi:hypothetical protein
VVGKSAEYVLPATNTRCFESTTSARAMSLVVPPHRATKSGEGIANDATTIVTADSPTSASSDVIQSL